MGPIKINSTYTKKCIDSIKVILSTNKSDDSTNKKEGEQIRTHHFMVKAEDVDEVNC